MVKLASLWKISFSSSFWHPNAPLGPKVPTQEPPQKWFSFRKRDERVLFHPLDWKWFHRRWSSSHLDISTDLIALISPPIPVCQVKYQRLAFVLRLKRAFIRCLKFKGLNTCALWYYLSKRFMRTSLVLFFGGWGDTSYSKIVHCSAPYKIFWPKCKMAILICTKPPDMLGSLPSQFSLGFTHVGASFLFSFSPVHVFHSPTKQLSNDFYWTLTKREPGFQ